jgi:hypothetical protein
VKARVCKGSITEERDWTARGSCDERRLGAKPVFTIELELSCDHEAAELFKRFLQEQLGYDLEAQSQVEPAGEMLPADGRRLPLLGGGR